MYISTWYKGIKTAGDFIIEKQAIAHLRKGLFFAFLSMWGEVEIFFVGEVIIASIDWAENTIYIDISTMNIVDIRPNV